MSTLSGGNQQKALLARWLLWDPEILFLDDPARGIDVGAKQDIYRAIDSLAARGKAIILVSSELPELLRCSDRILVLNEGRVTATFDAERRIAGENHGRGHGGAALKSVAALAAIVVLAILISPTASDGSRIFLQPGNLTDILRQVSLIGIISLAMTFVILTGGIDLSVGSILALATSLVAMFLTRALGRNRGRHPGGGGGIGRRRGGEWRGDRDAADSAVHRHAGHHDRHSRPGQVAHRQCQHRYRIRARRGRGVRRRLPAEVGGDRLVCAVRRGVLADAVAHRVRPLRARHRRQRTGVEVRRPAARRRRRCGST